MEFNMFLFSFSLYCDSHIVNGVHFAWSQKNKMVSWEAQSKLQWEEEEGSIEVGSGENLLPPRSCAIIHPYTAWYRYILVSSASGLGSFWGCGRCQGRTTCLQCLSQAFSNTSVPVLGMGAHLFALSDLIPSFSLLCFLHFSVSVSLSLPTRG